MIISSRDEHLENRTWVGTINIPVFLQFSFVADLHHNPKTLTQNVYTCCCCETLAVQMISRNFSTCFRFGLDLVLILPVFMGEISDLFSFEDQNRWREKREKRRRNRLQNVCRLAKIKYGRLITRRRSY